jgi:hypothetical protein
LSARQKWRVRTETEFCDIANKTGSFGIAQVKKKRWGVDLAGVVSRVEQEMEELKQ